MSYNLKNIKNEFKKHGVFYTPKELAYYMFSLIDVNITNVYDPTCGDGSLLSVFNDSIEKYGQELNSQQLEIAKQNLVNFNGFCGDTLQNPAFIEKKFDCIIANPPFSIKWQPLKDARFNQAPAIPPESKADYAFLLHIIYMLKQDGVAVVLNFPGILYRGNAEGKIREFLIKQNYIEKIIAIEKDTFVDTKIATVLLILKKNKKDNNIIFSNKNDNKTYIATIDEIEKNDFNLSINLYLREEKQKEVIDPIKLNDIARNDFLNVLKTELNFDNVVCNYENLDEEFFAKTIINTCNDFLTKIKNKKLKQQELL